MERRDILRRLDKLKKESWALYRNERCDACDNTCICQICFDAFLEEAFEKR